MTKFGQKREFNYTKSDRLLIFSVFKENNDIFDSDPQLFDLEPHSFWKCCMKFYQEAIY